MSKTLLVGGAGFIGRVVRDHLPSDDKVTVVDSYESQVHGASLVNRRAGEWGVFHAQYDRVIHLGAKVGVGQSMYDPVDYVACNSLDTAKFLKNLEANPPKRLVVASSMSVYGEGQVGKDWSGFSHPDTLVSVPTRETHPPKLTSIYALTKFDQEQLCLIWGKAHNVPTVALRFFNVYGPGQALTNPYTGALAIFATRLLNDKPPIIYEDGQQTRDFIHVDDVASAVVHAATSNIESGIYNIGTGIPRTIESVAILLAEKLGKSIKPTITRQRRTGDIRHCYADITKIRSTGWEPKVKFEDGIAEYCDWLKNQPIPEDKFDSAENELKTAGMLK